MCSLTAFRFSGIYVCPTCTTSTGRRTVSECLWSFPLTCPLRHLRHIRHHVVLWKTCPLPFRSIILRVSFTLMAHTFACLSFHVSSSNRQRYVLSVVRLCYPIAYLWFALHKMPSYNTYEPVTRRSHLSVV